MIQYIKKYVLIEKYRTKKCSKCEEIHPATLDYFESNKSNKYKLSSRCKICIKTFKIRKLKRKVLVEKIKIKTNNRYVLFEKTIKKQCVKCNEIKILELYPIDKNLISGFKKICKKCTNLIQKENGSTKRWYEAHKETESEKRKLRHINNKEHENKVNNAWYARNKNNRKETIKEYRENNPEKVEQWIKDYKPTLNKKRRERRKVDIIFKLKISVSNLIRGSFKRTGFTKRLRAEIILGCTVEEFRLHLEKQFEPWMNWNNYGMYNKNGDRTWCIDHFRPLASALTEGDVIKLNHYKNLRPLCSLENAIKYSKIIDYQDIS
jgi:hypothetical protein